MGEYKELFIVPCLSELVCVSVYCQYTLVWRSMEISLCMLTVQLELLLQPSAVLFKKNDCILSCVCVILSTTPRVFSSFWASSRWSSVCRGLLFELQWASVWFNWKFEESTRRSQIWTEEDYCNDSWLWVLSLVEWELQQPQTHSGRRGFARQTSAQGATCPDLILDIFGVPSENWWKENIELILVKIEEPAIRAHTHRHVRAHKHTRVRLQIHTAYDTGNPSLLWFLSWWGLEESRRG